MYGIVYIRHNKLPHPPALLPPPSPLPFYLACEDRKLYVLCMNSLVNNLVRQETATVPFLLNDVWPMGGGIHICNENMDLHIITKYQR
jgi:hypothetical protein